MRGTIEIAAVATEADALTAAYAVATVSSAMGGKQPTKVIYKAGKILNIIVPN